MDSEVFLLIKTSGRLMFVSTPKLEQVWLNQQILHSNNMSSIF